MRGVDFHDILENRAVVVHACEHAGLRGDGRLRRTHGRGLCSNMLKTVCTALASCSSIALMPSSRHPIAGPSADAPGLDLALILHLLKLGEAVIAELRQLDVVGHVQIDVVDAESLERLLKRFAHERGREILLAFLMRAGLRRIGVEVVAELSADLDFVAGILDSLRNLPKSVSARPLP